ncbi:protein MLO [Dorcoceras hygrometricum]|uniref:Protein MLO n=1 Tax=Dorcoceras hygrometricum TaxID=472368 RepID=A0A2Z7D9L1_9LAMI|nr:protein MLO [Dorcoceras hygrometricum]
MIPITTDYRDGRNSCERMGATHALNHIKHQNQSELDGHIAYERTGSYPGAQSHAPCQQGLSQQQKTTVSGVSQQAVNKARKGMSRTT